MANQTGTVRLHRVLRAPTERVYRAFTDKSALEQLAHLVEPDIPAEPG